MKLALRLMLLASLALGSFPLSAAEPARLGVAGDWKVNVECPTADGVTRKATVDIAPPAWVTVTAEKFARLPPFDAKGAPWKKGAPLAGVKAQECTSTGLLDGASLQLRSGPAADAPLLVRGKDYQADLDWGSVGRLPDGALKADQPVWASYRHALRRIDSIVIDAGATITVRPGQPHVAAPRPPELAPGQRRLGNVYLPGMVDKLSAELLFPVLETAYPEPPRPTPSVAAKLLPKTLVKLQRGEPLKILAWGDSVTVGTFVGDLTLRWQEQFVARLKQRFPQAKIELVTEAWGGRNTGSYLAEPPGSVHNYREKVLALRPDLIVSEFVNDAGLNPKQVQERYGKLLADFRGIGAEWIILTPHYVRPDWMKLTSQREIDDDPRPYVAGLRQFTAENNVPLADAARRWGRLWRQGIPYHTLMLNGINHPDSRGMQMFAESLMELF